MSRIIFFLLIAINMFTGLGISTASIQLQWPVNGQVLTGFGLESEYQAGSHRGIDIAGEPGTAVVSPADGTVAFVGKNTLPGSGGGMILTIDHENDISTTYLGIENVVVVKGQTVRRGERLAVIASSGDASSSASPHLHLGVYSTSRKNDGINRYVDPMNYLLSGNVGQDGNGAHTDNPVVIEPKPVEDIAVAVKPKPSTVIKPLLHAKPKPEKRILSTDNGDIKASVTVRGQAAAKGKEAYSLRAINGPRSNTSVGSQTKGDGPAVLANSKGRPNEAKLTALTSVVNIQKPAKSLKALAASEGFDNANKIHKQLSISPTSSQGEPGISHEEKVAKFFELSKWIVIQMLLISGVYSIIKMMQSLNLKAALG